MKRALTDAAVRRLKPPAKGQVDHFDAGYPGLALRVSYGGQRTWVFFVRERGKLKRLRLGVYPSIGLAQAREAWREARERVASGGPLKPQRDAFEAVARDWLKRDQDGNASLFEVTRTIERDVLPALAGRMVQTITRRDILDVLDGIVDRGATSHARHVHSYLHRLFRWAVGRGIIEVSPMQDLPKPGEKVDRDRVLSDVEIARLWAAAKLIGWPFGPIYQLLLLTAARRAEIGALEWGEVEAAGPCIRLPPERTKSGREHIVPLTPMAWRIVSDGPRIMGKFVFSTTGSTPVSGWSKAKAQLDAHMGVNQDWRVHDIRRTTATGLERLGVPIAVTESVLGHVSGAKAGIVSVYQRHQYLDEKREALGLWAAHLLKIIG